MMKVAVIGAGAAGLCCARHFGQFPSKFLVEIFEQTARIGGTWVYVENTGNDDYGLPVHSSMYKSLRYGTSGPSLGHGVVPSLVTRQAPVAMRLLRLEEIIHKTGA